MHRIRKIISVIGKLLLKRYVFRPVNELVPRDVLLFHCAILLLQLYIPTVTIGLSVDHAVSLSVGLLSSLSVVPLS